MHARQAWLPALLLALASAAAACPDDDGVAGASPGPPQFPNLLSGYAAAINRPGGPGCAVAGVDYRVGLPAGAALRDPAAGGLPRGCGRVGPLVTCTADGTTIRGWDFALHGGMGLVIGKGVAGTAIVGNRFRVGQNCLAPIRLLGPAGATTIAHNSIDGGGGLCPGLVDRLPADVFSAPAADGASIAFEWNAQENVGEDARNWSGPAMGAMRVVERFNLVARQGWRGHPDGTQIVGGNFRDSLSAHNTYWNPVFPGGIAGTQPLHIEAQLGSAISNWTVAYNTIVLPGACAGGRDWPAGCAANYAIACKRDGANDANAGFRAYGNHIDASGAIAALSDGYGCTATQWGVPLPNRDLRSGAALPAPR